MAKYDGGAVYQMYGTALITASSFINNSANNGGALFLDNVTKLLLISNSFINNSLERYYPDRFQSSSKEFSILIIFLTTENPDLYRDTRDRLPCGTDGDGSRREA